MEKKQNKKTQEKTNKVVVPVPTRGRVFAGTVTKKFPGRVVIEFERTIFVEKYERFYKKKTRIHARLPSGMIIEIGDYIKVRECRPLSKIIHAVVIEKVRSAQNAEVKK
ncbi:MAG: 30S ribosomal protein S17 [Nanoarchaeota archaeon]|nr:30S ribosomal protein S17 [Nanoarchaeota archaeon]